MDLNQVILVGRLADDLTYFEASDKSSSRIIGRLIVNRPPGASGKTNYDAIQIVAWGKQADAMARYTRKGKEVAITGELRTNNIAPTQEGGDWKNYTEVLVRRVSFGRDSNQQKVMKALSGSGEAPASLAALGAIGENIADFSKLLSQNPELRAELEAIAAGQRETVE